MVKLVHIHIGPHRTGSTAIQETLATHRRLLEAECGLSFANDRLVEKLGQKLRNGSAQRGLKRLAERLKRRSGEIVLSNEGLSGELPGRFSFEDPYRELLSNLQAIDNGLDGCECRYYFFVRDPAAWVRSAYVQLLKDQDRFTTQDDYACQINMAGLWHDVLSQVRAEFGARFIELPYREGDGYCAVEALLQALLGPNGKTVIPRSTTRPNRSPSDRIVAAMHAVSRSSATPEAKQAAKQRLMGGGHAADIPKVAADGARWPPDARSPTWLSPGLDRLWTRASRRVASSQQPDLLPPPDADLHPLRSRLVSGPNGRPPPPRWRMANQAEILKHDMRGQPETCYLLALAISYLRRDTPHTEKAAQVFHRLWCEEYEVLLGTLPVRWLISTFQTFMDHGLNAQQRQTGAAAFFFANMLKAYKAERALEGRAADAVYQNVRPVTGKGYPGLDRFGIGGTDLLLNTNALLLEQAAAEPCVGRVVQEFMLRTKVAETVFSRMDRSRIYHGVENPRFANAWSYFEPPPAPQIGVTSIPDGAAKATRNQAAHP